MAIQLTFKDANNGDVGVTKVVPEVTDITNEVLKQLVDCNIEQLISQGIDNKFTEDGGEISALLSKTEVFLINKVSAATPDTTELAKITTAKQGDFAIIQTTLATDKYDRTAYIYTKDSTWEALNGNYSAENVYFSENVTVTTTVGNHTTSSNIPIELAFEGKNLKQIYEYLYAKEDVNIAVNIPSASIVLSKKSDSLEVGTTYTLPTASISTSTGKYKEYGGKTAGGISVDKNTTLPDVTFDLTLSYKAPGESTAVEIASAEDTTSIAATTVPTDKQPTERKATDDTITHRFTGTYTHTATEFKPTTNLGNFVTALNSDAAESTTDYSQGVFGFSAKTTAGAITAQDYKVSGFRKWFFGGDNKTDFDVATIKELTNSTSAVTAQTFELKAASYANCSRILIAIPKNSNIQIKEVLLTSASDATITNEFKLLTPVQIGGVDNYSPIDYNIWQYKPGSLDSTEVYSITIG